MQMSPHTVRWIGQLVDQGWDLHLFPVNYLPVHPEMKGVTVHQPWFVLHPWLMLRTLLSDPGSLLRDWQALEDKLHPNKLPVRALYPIPVLASMTPYLNGAKRVRLGESDATAPLAYGPHALARLIREIEPDLVHSLEFQHCGYNVLRAKEISGGKFPTWLATNWGSDIFFYRQFEDHRKQISRLLRNIDYYSCECERDIGQARELGFNGIAMPVMPNTGGLDLDMVGRIRSMHPTAQRRLIMVKGYQHFAGRALTALEAVERCASALQGYQIIVFSASPEVHQRVKKLRKFVGLDVGILPYSTHEMMLRMFSRARIYLGISASDAISASLLEAMALGAFPIQTDTSCCDEWIEDGTSGFVVPVDDVRQIAERLQRALTDDVLVDSAAKQNWKTVNERLDQRIIKKSAVALYDQIFENVQERKGGAHRSRIESPVLSREAARSAPNTSKRSRRLW